MSTPYKQTDILLVDANIEEATVLEQSLEALNTNYIVDVVTGKEEAIEYLTGGEKNKPNIVIIESDDPKKLGLEIVEKIRTTSSLKKIKVLMVTPEYKEADIIACSQLDADYLVKPDDESKFLNYLNHRIMNLRRQI